MGLTDTVECPRCDGAGEIEVCEDRLDSRGEHYTRDWIESCRDCCGTGHAMFVGAATEVAQ